LTPENREDKVAWLMSRTNPRRPRNRPSLAATALLLVAVLLGTEFEAVAHRHGDAGTRNGAISLGAAPDRADPERPCSICRLADATSQTAPDPVRVSAPPVRPGDALPWGVVVLVTGPVPLRSPRAPPAPSSC